jgi:hypothetical protein
MLAHATGQWPMQGALLLTTAGIAINGTQSATLKKLSSLSLTAGDATTCVGTHITLCITP